MKLKKVLSDTTIKLSKSGIEGGARDARILTAYALGIPISDLSLKINEQVSRKIISKLEKLINRRIEREPISKILERREFWGRSFSINENVLDPRGDTETLIDYVIEKPVKSVLELGTGCGYQTAVLSYFCENIYSIERIKPLVNKARENLNELKLRNVELIYGDGFEDWDNTIKYDGVICAAAPREYPHELVDSLTVSAKILIPVGNSKSQQLNVINKILMCKIKSNF